MTNQLGSGALTDITSCTLACKLYCRFSPVFPQLLIIMSITSESLTDWRRICHSANRNFLELNISNKTATHFWDKIGRKYPGAEFESNTNQAGTSVLLSGDTVELVYIDTVVSQKVLGLDPSGTEGLSVYSLHGGLAIRLQLLIIFG